VGTEDKRKSSPLPDITSAAGSLEKKRRTTENVFLCTVGFFMFLGTSYMDLGII